MTTTAFKLKYLTTVGFCADTGGRGFMLPTAMTIRRDGRVFVASRSNGIAREAVGIQMVTRNHDFFGQIGAYGKSEGQTIWPSAVTLDDEGKIFLADDYLHRITVFDSEGNAVSSWGIKGDGEGEFNGPSGLLCRGERLLVVDHRNHRVQTYTKEGVFIEQWGSYGDGEGQLNLPWGISDDKDGAIYVADWRNDRIQKFTADGRFIASYGESGDGDGQLHRPSDVAVDSDGNVYVADWGNQRLQVFDSAGRFLTKERGQADLNPWALEYLEGPAGREEGPRVLRSRVRGRFRRPQRGFRQDRALLLGPRSGGPRRRRAGVRPGDQPVQAPDFRGGVGTPSLETRRPMDQA